jgi:hypothetical protein
MTMHDFLGEPGWLAEVAELVWGQDAEAKLQHYELRVVESQDDDSTWTGQGRCPPGSGGWYRQYLQAIGDDVEASWQKQRWEGDGWVYLGGRDDSIVVAALTEELDKLAEEEDDDA